jgi:hypothetical protein
MQGIDPYSLNTREVGKINREIYVVWEVRRAGNQTIGRDRPKCSASVVTKMNGKDERRPKNTKIQQDGVPCSSWLDFEVIVITHVTGSS